MPGKRVYNDQEISAILKRASELQHDRGTADRAGLSVEELEQVAAEVGIDPAFVKTAILEMETTGTPKADKFYFWGAPMMVDLDRIVEGELTEAAWEEVVGVIRRTYGTAGETSTLGRSMEWIRRTSTSSQESLHITATPMEGQTRIRVLARLANGAAAFHATLTMYGAMFGLIVPLAMLSLAPVLEVGIGLAIALVSFLIARWGYKMWAGGQERKAQKLVDQIGDVLSDMEASAPAPARVKQAAPVAAPLVEAPTAQRIDPALLDDAAGSEYAAPAARAEQEGPRRRRVP